MVITHLPPCHLLATLLTSLHPNYYCAFLTMLSLDPVPVTSESSGLCPFSPSPVSSPALSHFCLPPSRTSPSSCLPLPSLSLKMGFPLWCKPSHHTPILSLCPMPFRPLVSSGLLRSGIAKLLTFAPALAMGVPFHFVSGPWGQALIPRVLGRGRARE